MLCCFLPGTAGDIFDHAAPQVANDCALVIILDGRRLVGELELNAINGDGLNLGERSAGNDDVWVGSQDSASTCRQVGGVREGGVVGAVVIREEGHPGNGL